MSRKRSEHTESESREEFTRLWLAAESSVSTYVFASITEFHNAEDVVQQIALNAASRFDEFDAEPPFLGWVLWIAIASARFLSTTGTPESSLFRRSAATVS